nr:MAG TPA: hypothetical protein [Caudoviricetes sp.]
MGGGSLKWGPPLVKRDLEYRFLPRFKWVSGPEWVCGSYEICQKFSASGFVVFGKFVKNFRQVG